jgi:hypothetical protein
MARKNRPGAAREAFARQQAQARRGAPGKRFIGDRAAESAAARRAELATVERMAEIDSALRRADEVGEPVSAILAELVQDATRLLRSLLLAPLRIAVALRQPRHA